MYLTKEEYALTLEKAREKALFFTRHDDALVYYNIEGLKPFKRLKVLRETYCTQEQVERTLDWFQHERSAWIIEELSYVPYVYEPHYKYTLYFYDCVMQELKKAPAEIQLPDDTLARLDFATEMHRRLALVYGFGDMIVEPVGKPIAIHRGSAIPPIPQLKELRGWRGYIHYDWYKSKEHREAVEKILSNFWRDYPAIVYEIAELSRQGFRLREISKKFASYASTAWKEFGLTEASELLLAGLFNTMLALTHHRTRNR